MSKILEKIVYEKLYDYLVSNDIFDPHQFGFRSNHSCIDCVTKFSFDVLKNRSLGKHTMACFADLSKAFDSISHNVLFAKLDHYGIRGKTLFWFKSYFNERTQCTKIDSCISNPVSLDYGVGQGSILGPLILSIITFDVFSICKYSTILGYADDMTLYHGMENIVTLFARIKHDLRILIDWFKANKLSLNIDKNKIHVV